MFPVVAGIPDLRLVEGPFISNEGDRAKAARLEEEGQGKTFDQMVASYYAMTPEVPPADAVRFGRGIASARARAARWLDQWERTKGARGEPVLLDVGCGTAPMLQAAAGRYGRLLGVDIALRWLVIARRGLEERGIRAELVCASADALPFPDGAVTRVTFMAALEHIPEQAWAMKEAHRVLAAGGACHVMTPNRFSLGPDPHLGVWAGGYLPSGVVRWLARAKRALPPERHLLSRGGLRGLFAAGGFRRVDVRYPVPAPEQLADQSPTLRRLGTGYATLLGVPLVGPLVGGIGPLVEGTAIA